ncbi:surface lipoprotein assembly modifier [Thioclava sp. DLFJ4-1]|uniref:surface lipoprotein assembly modifier n=1 Tax=Thioclava sp. DLFJ4-1 TaxID=1915313 RepID=UPI0009983EFA|nr:surface lipoprotein assembly modifier [Thioclava sp. DLFJ4-1]OOY15111.1 hypothetical protein BMI85_16320 [Thioclava sp. DLFJ4-1]
MSFSKKLLTVTVAFLACATPLSAAPQEHSLADWTRIGARLSGKGDTLTAITILGTIAAKAPNYSPAQFALERSLDQIGSAKRADRVLRYVSDRAPDRELAFNAALRRLDQSHPWRISGQVSLLPTSNLGHVSSQTVFVTKAGRFQITDGGRESSGLGLGASASVDYYIHPALDWRLRLRGAVSGNWYSPKELRFVKPSLSVRYDRLIAGAPWGATIEVGRSFYAAAPGQTRSDATDTSLSLDRHWRLAHDANLTVIGSVTQSRFEEKRYLNGPRYALNLGYDRAIWRRSRIDLGLRLERADVRSDYQSYTRAALTVGASRRLTKTLSVKLSATVGVRDFDGDFPLFGKPRMDRDISLTASVGLDRFKVMGTTPQLSCTARRNRSNVSLYSYRSLDCGVHFISRF